MADQLVTLAQVRRRVGITDAGDTDSDVLLGELNDEISDLIEDLTGRQFVASSGVTMTFDTASGSQLDIPRGIRAVTSIGYASTDQPDTGGTYTAISAADILLRPSSLSRRNGWPATSILIRGTSPVFSDVVNGAQVVGDFGWATVPPAIQGVALDAIASAFTATRDGAAAAVGPNATPAAIYARILAPGTFQREVLDRYRAGGIGIA